MILSLYRAPSREINEFLRRLDAPLRYLYNPKSEFISCGDININYLNESSQKKQVNSLLGTYNLLHTVNFCNKSSKFLK
jgi:hypothetical protein